MSDKYLLVIGYTWPEPTSTAAGNRMLQLLHFFLGQHYRIVFASTASETELSMDLEALGITKAAIELNNSGFDGFVKDLNPAIVLFDRFLTEEQFGWRVAESAPAALRILDTEDLHSLRSTREAEFKRGIPFTTDAWLQNDMTKREIASIYRCDLSLIISTYEMKLLTKTLKIDGNLLLYLPFMLDTLDEKATAKWNTFEVRKDFISIGNGKHAPNVDATVWLRQEIWPKIRKKLPKSYLTVYGAYLPQHIERMHSPQEGFLVKGWTDDAKTAMGNAKVNLVPLRFGAGIKGKLILAMQTGTPSVTTSIGAEGMHGDLPWSGKIAETAEDIAKAAIQLHNDENDWLQAQQNGAALIDRSYRKEKVGKRLNTKILELLQNLHNHRTQNFMGTLLLHHSVQSTKYLSKWIEEKNAKDRI